MIGADCKHKVTGVAGKVTHELRSGKTFPEQWGIVWQSEAYKKEMPYHSFWQNKTDIELTK